MVNSRIMNCLIWYKCQHEMDRFGRHIRERIGTEHITQYIHAMIAGHFTQFINRKPGEYLNIFDHNQIGIIHLFVYLHENYLILSIGLEHCIKKIRTYLNKRSQQGGHKQQSYSKSPPKTQNVQAAGSLCIRNVIQRLGKLEGNDDFSSSDSIVFKTASQGKQIRKDIKNSYKRKTQEEELQKS